MLHLQRKNIQKLNIDKNYHKDRDNCYLTGKYRGAPHSTCNLKINTPSNIPVAFYNGSIYNYHFTVKELSNEFKGQFVCLGGNRQKYKTFSVLIEKKVRKIDKDGNENIITISYKVKLVDSPRFMKSFKSYQILPIILQKEFTKLNINIATIFLNTKISLTIK